MDSDNIIDIEKFWINYCRNHQQFIPTKGCGVRPYQEIVIFFLSCDYTSVDLEPLINRIGAQMHRLASTGQMDAVSNIGPKRLRVISEILAAREVGMDQFWTLGDYFALLAEILSRPHGSNSINRKFRKLLQSDILCALQACNLALGNSWTAASEWLILFYQQLDVAARTGTARCDQRIAINRLPELGLSNAVGLYLDIQMMRGGWRDRRDVFRCIELVERALPFVHKEGIRSHGVRLSVAVENSRKLANCFENVALGHRPLTIAMPAWGAGYIRQMAELPLVQLLESWKAYNKNFWTNLNFAFFCREGESNTVSEVVSHLDLPQDVMVCAVEFDDVILNLNKNLIMSTVFTSACLFGKVRGHDIYMASTDSFFGVNTFSGLGDWFIRSGKNAFFTSGFPYSTDILGPPQGVSKARRPAPINTWNKFFGPRFKQLRLDARGKIHNVSQISKHYESNTFTATYLTAVELGIITREGLKALDLPHWFTGDTWVYELLESLEIAAGEDRLVLDLNVFPHGSLDGDESLDTADSHFQSLLTELVQGDEFFKLFRETRKAHKLTPALCRLGCIPVIIGEPDTSEFAIWEVGHAIYCLAMELVALESEEMTNWGIPYSIAGTIAKSFAAKS